MAFSDVFGGSSVATELVALRKIIEADQILVDVSGTRVLKTYERGTTAPLIPDKTAKQPDGNDLTDPTTQRLAGYQESA